MSAYCKQLQNRLGEAGIQAVGDDPIAQAHIAECDQCFSMFDAVSRLDRLLPSLPVREAPAALIEATLDSISAAEPAAEARPLRAAVKARLSQLADTPVLLYRRMQRYPGQSALALSLLVVLAIAPMLYSDQLDNPALSVLYKQLAKTPESNKDLGAVKPAKPDMHRGYEERLEAAPAEQALVGHDHSVSSSEQGAFSSETVDEIAEPVTKGNNEFAKKLRTADTTIDAEFNDLNRQQGAGRKAQAKKKDRRDTAQHSATDAELYDAKPARAPRAVVAERENQTIGAEQVDSVTGDTSSTMKVIKERGSEAVEFSSDNDEQYRRAGRRLPGEPGAYADVGVGAAYIDGLTSLEENKNRSAHAQKAVTDHRQVFNLAQEFLQARENLDGLSFKPAAGYWANSYIPGDATIRRLQTALLDVDYNAMQQSVNRPLQLHRRARPTGQPFDTPVNSALAVYLHADQTGLQSRRRMLVQVGLQGSSRRSGSRPAMNVGLVFDLRGDLDSDTLERMEALLFALNKARDIGDRFSLVVAGKAGGLMVAPEQFRHGPLLLTMQQLQRQNAETDTGLTLDQALASAIDQVGNRDDANAPLGSSVVLLVTNQSLGDNINALSQRAHQSAVNGVPISVIAAGAQADIKALDRLVLAGQGNRRILARPVAADRLIAKELSAVSEIVARAVRLRIRLAPGVRLVDVIGSYRLGRADAERVRQAEQSIDRRLAKNLGIAADRGADEAGLQIVIPAYYADTAHVVMLDVVAEKPGPIAEVTVRYKDLVQLKNGVTRASLALGHSQTERGPLERNVTKNYLAMQLAQQLEAASRLLAAGRSQQCLAVLNRQKLLLESFRDTIPGFDRDPGVAADINLLQDYLTLLSGRSDNGHRRTLIDSMAYAGKMKILPRIEAH